MEVLGGNGGEQTVHLTVSIREKRKKRGQVPTSPSRAPPPPSKLKIPYRPHLLKVSPPSNSTKPLCVGLWGTFSVQTIADSNSLCTGSWLVCATCNQYLVLHRCTLSLFFISILPWREESLQETWEGHRVFSQVNRAWISSFVCLGKKEHRGGDVENPREGRIGMWT